MSNKIEIELTSQYLFKNNTIDNIIQHIERDYQDDQQQRNEIIKLENDINVIIKLFDDFNPNGTDGTIASKINSFNYNYRFKLKNSDNKILNNSSTIINHIISPKYGETKKKLNETKKIDEGSSWPITIFKTSEWHQIAGKFNNIIDQNTQLNDRLIEYRAVIENLLKTQQEKSDELERLKTNETTQNEKINMLISEQTELNDQLAAKKSEYDVLQIRLDEQNQVIIDLHETLSEQEEALKTNKVITQQARIAAEQAQTEAAEARIAAEQAQTEAAAARIAAEKAKAEAAAAQTSAETDKKNAEDAKTQAEDAKTQAEAAKTQAEAQLKAAKEQLNAAEAAQAQAEAAQAEAEEAKTQADGRLTEMKNSIADYIKANEELTENQKSSQTEIANLNTTIQEAQANLQAQITKHNEAITKQQAAQNQEIEKLKNQHEAALEAKKQEFNAQKNVIKIFSSLTNFAKQKKIKALEKQFKKKEAAHNKSIAELENISKRIIREKEAKIEELTSEVTKLKIDKDGNVKGPLTTITRLFPLAWQNSKGYNIGNIITLVRGDKPYSTTDNVDHYLYNLFQSIQEDTGKTSTDAKKKYDKKYKSYPYQQHVSKNIPINKGYNNNNNIARATMIEKTPNPNSNDKILQTGLATVVPSRSKKMGGERKSKKHQKQKKHNNTKKQKINKTKK